MGQLKVVAGGIQLSGQALVLDVLRASSIRSRHGQPISIGTLKESLNNTIIYSLLRFPTPVSVQIHSEISPSTHATGTENWRTKCFSVTTSCRFERTHLKWSICMVAAFLRRTKTRCPSVRTRCALTATVAPSSGSQYRRQLFAPNLVMSSSKIANDYNVGKTITNFYFIDLSRRRDRCK